MQEASAKITPLLNDLKATMKQANDTLSHVDAIAVENQKDIRQTVVSLRETMLTASALLEQLKNTTDLNVENIDSILVNIRVTTDNLKQLSESLKTRPSVLIRGNTVKDRKPGERCEVGCAIKKASIAKSCSRKVDLVRGPLKQAWGNGRGFYAWIDPTCFCFAAGVRREWMCKQQADPVLHDSIPCCSYDNKPVRTLSLCWLRRLRGRRFFATHRLHIV